MMSSPSKTQFSVLLSHTGHDAEHLGPDDIKRENSTRSIVPANCIIVLLVHTDLPAGLPTTKGNTKRGEKPAKRALHITLPESTMSAPLSFWSIPAMMQGIVGLTTTIGNTA